MAPQLEEHTLGSARILFGENNGKYPDANCVLVSGSEQRMLLDTSLGLVARGHDEIGPVDRILLTHCHEDHIPGNRLYPDVPVAAHRADVEGLRTLEGMLDIFTQVPRRRARLRKLLLDTYGYEPRADAEAFDDGALFDLGGGTTIEVIHTPGHTRGHCAFRIEPDDLIFLGDVDLSSFGPFYADDWSSLDEFEATLEKVSRLTARWYLSSHHVGLVDHPTFVDRLARYRSKLAERGQRLLAFLDEPRTMADITEHRFVYRPQDQVPDAEAVEEAMMGQHLERFLRQGRVEEVEPGSYRAVPGAA
jgi:glyoxylase-like metal-dependent hydrolase (beta-lactamase superfamily II)